MTVLVRLPLDELVRAGADRVLAGIDAGLFQRRRAPEDEHEHRQVVQEGALRVLEGELDGGGIDRFDLGDDAVVVKPAELVSIVLEGLAGLHLGVVQWVLGVLPVVEVLDHGVGVEVSAVMELDALAQR